MRNTMRQTFRAVLPVVAILYFPSTAILAQGAQKTHEVKAEEFEIELELTGVFAAEEATEVSLEPKSWSEFKVTEAVPHGTKVSEGQVLVRFDDEKLNEAIEDMEADQQLAELSIMQAEEELPRLEKSLDLQYETAERGHRIAQEDLERWNEIDRPLAIKAAEFSLKTSKNNLEYQQEELEQLQQMYEADDLTEETEEIILKRQRNAVESAEYSYNLAKVRSAEVLEVQIPRTDASMKTALERAELELAEAKTALAFSINEKQFALQKAKHERKRAVQRLSDLLADRELMAIKAPQDGVVYYGRAVEGKWSGMQTMMENLKPGGSVSPRSVFMTVVQTRPLQVLSTVEEKSIVEIESGATAEVIPTADEKTKIAAKVSDKSAVPVGEGRFSLEVDLTGELPDWVMPGMTCQVKVTTYSRDDALTVPEAAVRTDEEDGEKRYVLVQVEGQEEPERRDVEVGKTHGGKTEILEGVAAGDRVVVGDTNTEEEPAHKEDKTTDEAENEDRESDAEDEKVDKASDREAEDRSDEESEDESDSGSQS